MIDIGVNLTNSAFGADRDAVIARALESGVEQMIITGTNLDESEAAIALARQHPDVLTCTAGIHPHDAARAPVDWRRQLTALHTHAQVRAVGETGLDFNRNYSPRDVQIERFRAQIDLAVELRKPLFVHDRDTQGMTAAVLEERAGDLQSSGIAVVIHCFTGTGRDLTGWLEAGFHIGVTGWVCDERRGAELQRLVPQIPADRLLLETDAPYLTPRSIPKAERQRRNEPANLIWVAREVARLRDVPLPELQQQTAANARRVFALN